MRCAWFSQTHRLAINLNGQVTIDDTLDHQIGGVSQQEFAAKKAELLSRI